jgi:hypothetical protein
MAGRMTSDPKQMTYKQQERVAIIMESCGYTEEQAIAAMRRQEAEMAGERSE